MIKFLKFLLFLIIIAFAFFLGVRFSDFFKKSEISQPIIESVITNNGQGYSVDEVVEPIQQPINSYEITPETNNFENVEVDLFVPEADMIYTDGVPTESSTTIISGENTTTTITTGDNVTTVKTGDGTNAVTTINTEERINQPAVVNTPNKQITR